MRIAALAATAVLFAAGAHGQSRLQAAVAALAPSATAARSQIPVRPSGPLQKKVAPGLADYTDEILFGEVWPGAGLSPRDRSLVIISALIATNKPAQLQGHLGRGLGYGLTPIEASGLLTHLAFYAGWPNVVSALEVYDKVYTERNIDLAALQTARSAIPRSTSNGPPNFSELDQRVVLGNLWRRSDLNARDRSLVTIATLAAMGDHQQLGPYVRRGLEAGLTRPEIEQALTHLAFYAGWSKARSALDVIAQTSGGERQAGPRSAAGGTRVSRKGSSPITSGPTANFTGAVRVSAPFRGTNGSRIGGATVTFQPGARSAWHRHPLGQLLVVTEGCGWTQAERGPIEKICAGDVAWIGPGEKHWHGATPTTAMSHVAASESIEGQNVEWLEKVSDQEYGRGIR